MDHLLRRHQLMQLAGAAQRSTRICSHQSIDVCIVAILLFNSAEPPLPCPPADFASRRYNSRLVGWCVAVDVQRFACAPPAFRPPSFAAGFQAECVPPSGSNPAPVRWFPAYGVCRFWLLAVRYAATPLMQPPGVVLCHIWHQQPPCTGGGHMPIAYMIVRQASTTPMLGGGLPCGTHKRLYAHTGR